MERIRLDSGPGHRDRGMHREGRCLERVGVYYSPCFLYTLLLLSLSLSLSLQLSTTLLPYPSPIYYFPLPPPGSCQTVVQIQFYAVVLISIFTKERGEAERKGRRQPTTPAAATITTEANPVAYASALRIRFEDNRRCGVTRAPCELNQFETEGGGWSVSGSTSLHQLS